MRLARSHSAGAKGCPCRGCSPPKKSNLNFMFPSALKRFRRHLLAILAGCDVCCILQCSSDGRVWSPICRPDKETVNALTQVWHCIAVVGQIAIKVCDQTTPAPRLLGRLSVEEATHTSRAALHPGTAAVVKRAAGVAVL